jgi:energy-coupling factor transport system substrate-specific component
MKTSAIVIFNRQTYFVLAGASIVSLAGFLWPFFIHSSTIPRTTMFFWVATALAIFLLIMKISNDSLDAKSIALLGVLTAVVAALRPLGAGAVGIEPMWFVLILSARVFGPSFGFILGLTSIFTSALLTGGLGPWLGYQLFAGAWIGLFAGLLPRRLRGRQEIAILVFYSFCAALIFGLLMDLQFWPWALGLQSQLSLVPGASIATNFHRFLIFHFATSMAWDIPRAIFTSVLVIVSAPAILSALRRTKFKAAFVTPIEFLANKESAIARAKEQTVF